jgi:hypothetical protein
MSYNEGKMGMNDFWVFESQQSKEVMYIEKTMFYHLRKTFAK